MKKLCIGLVIVALLVSSGCNQSEGNDAIQKEEQLKTNGSSVDTKAASNDSTDIAISGIDSVDSNNSSETTSSDGSEVKNNTSEGKSNTSSYMETYSSNYEHYVDSTHTRPKIFTVGTSEAVNKFVDWCKDVKANGDPENEYTQSSKFIGYLKSHNEILIPTILKENYEEYSVSTYIDDKSNPGYEIVYHSEGEPTFYISVVPISKQSSASNKKQLLKDYVESKFNVLYVSENSQFGEYYVTSVETRIRATFIVNDFIVTLRRSNNNGTIKEWDPEYFEYFDFETVSLK